MRKLLIAYFVLLCSVVFGTDFTDPGLPLTTSGNFHTPAIACDTNGLPGVIYYDNRDMYFFHPEIGFGNEWNVSAIFPHFYPARNGNISGDSHGLFIVTEFNNQIATYNYPVSMIIPTIISPIGILSVNPSLTLKPSTWYTWQNWLGGVAEIWFKENGNLVFVDMGTQPNICSNDSGEFSIAFFNANNELNLYTYTSGSGFPYSLVTLPTPIMGDLLEVELVNINNTWVTVFSTTTGTDVNLYWSAMNGSGSIVGPYWIDTTDNMSSFSINSYNDEVALIYAKNGTINLMQDLMVSPVTETITDLGTYAEDPDIAYDKNGFLHVVYTINGNIFYENNVPPPVANFTISPTSGSRPLNVLLSSTSSGTIWGYNWDFGDGTVDSDGQSTADHTYVSVGTWDIVLVVFGPGGSDTLTIQDAITIEEAPYRSKIEEGYLRRGFSGTVDIVSSAALPSQGLQLSISFDTTEMSYQDLVLSALIDSVGIEFFATNSGAVGTEGYVVAGAITDFSPPWDGHTIPSLDQEIIAHLTVNVLSTAPLGESQLKLEHSLGSPPIMNIFTINGLSEICILDYEPIFIIDTLPFIRGDANHDNQYTISDIIYTLSYLFIGGINPFCLDALDMNDSGSVDIADAMFGLSSLFIIGSPPPPAPYPDPGEDPTIDPIVCLP